MGKQERRSRSRSRKERRCNPFEGGKKKESEEAREGEEEVEGEGEKERIISDSTRSIPFCCVVLLGG